MAAEKFAAIFVSRGMPVFGSFNILSKGYLGMKAKLIAPGIA